MGFEPTTPQFQAGNSDQAELPPDKAIFNFGAPQGNRTLTMRVETSDPTIKRAAHELGTRGRIRTDNTRALNAVHLPIVLRGQILARQVGL